LALKARGWIGVPSHEWIYQYIYKDKANGGDLHKCLRSQKTYRKRGLKNNDRRGQLANRTSIHCRSKEIDQRERIGDFEGDTVIGKNHKGVLLTLVDRKSLYVHIVHLGRTRQSNHTITQCIERLKLSHAHSVTFDNGKEFSEHERLTHQGIATYFADSYKSNQRARNENTHGLIRQFLPKSSSFENVTEVQIRAIEDNLNNRPRKTLGWSTPSEVMAGFFYCRTC
jgi:IS30 family transposase